jgi:hypothetical protein
MGLCFPAVPVVARVPQGEASLAGFLAARKDALADLSKWIGTKQEGNISETSPVALLGPTMDHGTYFYRIGQEDRLRGWGMGYGPMLKLRESLIKHGAPMVDSNEIELVNKTQYRTLVSLRSRRKFVVKHFPGGDEFLEATEIAQVHYGDDKPIPTWIKGFDAALDGSSPPWGIMLGHASYNLWKFPGIERMPMPEVPDYVRRAICLQFKIPAQSSLLETFSLVPASLNPLITAYLRTVKGYKGVIVGDWYNMRSISEFCAYTLIHPEDKDRPKFSQEDTAFLLAVLAGINYVRPIRFEWFNQDAWRTFRERHADDYSGFERQLNRLILQTYSIVKSADDPEVDIAEVERLPFRDRVNLVADEAQGPLGRYREDDEKEIARAFDKVATGFGDPNLYRVINRMNPVLPNDIWERGCVLTMMYRKSFLERVTGKQFPDAPIRNELEREWFDHLVGDTDFQKAYRAVNWSQLNAFRTFD